VGSVLLAAKVLVISRLLHKKLSSWSKALPYLETVRNRLASLRLKLLLRINSIYQRLDITEDELVGAMCAFSLATSSSPTDVLRHYQHIRLGFLNKQAQDGSNVEVAMVEALQYFINTLQDTKAYIPGKLAQALQAIKSTPIFQSEDLHSISELNLDVHERWIDEDIKMFIPYIRDVELKKAEAGRASKDWAKQAFMSFSTILQRQLDSINDATVITRLRKNILTLWLSTPQRSLGVDTADIFEGLHDIFINQTIRLIRSHTMSLRKTAEVIEQIIHKWTRRSSDDGSTLWASSIASIEISHAGKAFTELVLAKFNGRDDALEATSLEYKAWLQRVGHLEVMIREIRETKWEDAVDEMEDDENVLDDKQIQLSNDDPRLLHNELYDALRKSLMALQDSIEGFASELDEPNRGEKAAYLLRVWKEVQGQLPSYYREPGGVGINCVLKLQELMAGLAINAPLSGIEELIIKSGHHEPLVNRPLWEGNPELPVFPSSWVFRLLHDIVHSMTALGSDIWNPQATNIVKKQLRAGLASHFRISVALDAESNDSQSHPLTEPVQQQEANGTDFTDGKFSPGGQKSVNKDNRIQRVFDMLYLNVATTWESKLSNSEDDELAEILKATYDEVDLDEDCVRRMKRNGEEYWKRTSMLFALMG
jgi:hypothetical protein